MLLEKLGMEGLDTQRYDSDYSGTYKYLKQYNNSNDINTESGGILWVAQAAKNHTEVIKDLTFL